MLHAGVKSENSGGGWETTLREVPKAKRSLALGGLKE